MSTIKITFYVFKMPVEHKARFYQQIILLLCEFFFNKTYRNDQPQNIFFPAIITVYFMTSNLTFFKIKFWDDAIIQHAMKNF